VTKVLSLRVPDDLAEWVTAYAKKRGVTRQALLEDAVRSFRRDCEPGLLSAITANAAHPGGELTEEVLADALEQGSKPRPVIPALSERERLAIRTDALRMMGLRAPESAHGRAKK
jgi:predicted transcriptional regulator